MPVSTALKVDAPMKAAGANPLAMVVDARIAHVWADSMVLEVDAPMNCVGALSRALTVETASTHAGTDLMVLKRLMLW